MTLNGLQRAGLGAAVVAGIVLLAALSTEWWGGLVPCALCLLERWPYRVVMALGVLAAVSRRTARAFIALAALAMLGGAVVGVTHVGVEQGAWPSPLPECAAPKLGSGTIAERLARMPARPSKPCDEPTYLVPGLPVSMAAMNLILSAALCLGLATIALRDRSTA